MLEIDSRSRREKWPIAFEQLIIRFVHQCDWSFFSFSLSIKKMTHQIDVKSMSNWEVFSMKQKYYIDIVSISYQDFTYKRICNNYNIRWEKVCGVFLMPSNGKNATNFFPHLILQLNKTVITGVAIYYLFKATRK